MQTLTKIILSTFLSLIFLPGIKAQETAKQGFKSSANKEGFIENKGQIMDQHGKPNTGVRYLLNQPGLNVQLKANGFSYDTYVIEQNENSKSKKGGLLKPDEQNMSINNTILHFHRIDIKFLGANSFPQILAEQKGGDYLNYYTIGTPEEGITNVRHYGKITYKDLYPGIDLEFLVKPGAAKSVEYNFIVHPGSDISTIKWQYEGSHGVKIENGMMQIMTAHGTLSENIPLSFEKETGKGVNITYRSFGDGVYSFEGTIDHQKTIIIDPLPILNWASYYGGSVLDELDGVSSDASGNLFLTGETTSTSAIATTGAHQTTMVPGTIQYAWGGDAFIVKLSASGTRLWGTYFGGNGEDMGWSIKTDKNGDVFVAGDTKSTNQIATTGAFQTAFAGSYHDPFLAKFSSTGTRLWGTYFGGTGNDRATRNGLAVDTSGNVYITGTNNTANNMWITTAGAYQRTNGSTSAYDEPFVAKFSPTGTLIWGTYYGGVLHDQCAALALDANNNVYLVGNATSTALIATTGAHQTALAGGQDAFIAKINSTGSALLWATYFGGTGTDVGNSVVVDANGDVYMSGYTTSSAGIASSGAYKTSFQGGSYDGFLAKFNSTGTRLWSTYTGGSDYDVPRSMALNKGGDVIVIGHTTSASGITTSDGFQTTYIGGTYDGYISKFSSTGAYKLGTYFGGNLEDIPWQIEMDSKSNMFIVGRTTSTSGLATSGTHQSAFGGGTYDGFIIKFQDLVADLSIESFSINPNPVCSDHSSDVTVKIKNYGPIPALQMVIGIDLVGQNRILSTTILNNLGVGKDTTVTIAGLFKSNISGANLTLKAINLSTDLNSLNDTAKIKVDIRPSPSGSSLVKGMPFTSPMSLTTGVPNNPDIVAEKDTLTYEITTPNGHLNKDYLNTWRVADVTLRTKGGRVLSAGYYKLIFATFSSNAKVQFLPDMGLTDTAISMSVSLQVLSGLFCDSTLTRSIFVAPRAIPDFSFNTVCDGDNVIFTNNTRISSGNFTSKWDFGTGNPADTSNTTDVVFEFPVHGVYNVTLTTTSSPYGYVTKKTYAVVVNEIPKIGFKVFNACFGDSVSFVNTTTISKGSITYKWDLGNGTSSAKVNPKQRYAVAGSYRVTLVATSNGCSQTLTKNAWEFARPVAKFTTPQVLCDKTEIQFINGSTISMGNMGYRWTFSDGGTSTAASPLHAFATPGSKNVKVKAISEFGCADSTNMDITLDEAPLAEFTYGPVCNLTNTNFKFTGTKPGGNVKTVFNWDFGGEGSTSLENPSKLLKVIGKKNIALTVTCDNGCADLITKEVNVKLQSKADFEVSDICEGEDAIFVNKSTISSGNLNYLWKFGDGKISIAQSPRHLYDNSGHGSYNVTLVAKVPGGCSDSITKQMAINSTPESDFSFTTSGRLVNFKPKQPGSTIYHWKFGDGGTSEIPNAQYHYLNSFEYGKFTACLFVENAAGCYSQTCKEIVITGGINQLIKKTGIQVYPNPNNGNFMVTIEDVKPDISIAICNVLGDIVKTIETNLLKSSYTINADLANGVYLLKVTNGGLVTTQKVTISSK